MEETKTVRELLEALFEENNKEPVQDLRMSISFPKSYFSTGLTASLL